MRIFKFGGASVKDAESVKNVANVLQTVGYDNTFIIVSAMGKTTNAMEKVIEVYFEKGNFEQEIKQIKDAHFKIINDLFENNSATIQEKVELICNDLNAFFRRNKSPNYNYVYDQVVCHGELISTTIISAYLNHIGIENQWLDARDYIKTDNTYREGKVDWLKTQEKINELEKNKLYISQGFIGSDSNYFTTTLGREGSDYSASIFGYCLDAESITIWKDVPGVLNADPRHFSDTELLEKISYEEAIELAYYGASVIHPKTLQPLKRKGIPLYVKSFINPKNQGTEIHNGQIMQPLLPCFIVKKNQFLIRFTSKDFSFITEEILAEIFTLLKSYQIKVNLMQTLAVSLSLCLEDKYGKMDDFLTELNERFNIEQNKNVSLYTIRHFNEKADKIVSENKKTLLRQTIENTLQIVTA